MILASLIKGISDLKDISKFKIIGLRTIVVYVFTTIIAISIGLILVNVFEPGNGVSNETVSKLTDTYSESSGVQQKLSTASKQKDIGPLQFIEDMVPDNVFKAFSDNRLMLQVIFISIFLGISMLLIGDDKAKPLKSIFDSLNDVVLKMVDLIMLTAPYAVFALLANVVVSSDDPEILMALLKYAFVIVFGLILMIVVYFYSVICIAGVITCEYELRRGIYDFINALIPKYISWIQNSFLSLSYNQQSLQYDHLFLIY